MNCFTSSKCHSLPYYPKSDMIWLVHSNSPLWFWYQLLDSLLFFFNYCHKISWPRQFPEERVYLSLWFQRYKNLLWEGRVVANSDMVVGAECWELHLVNYTHGAEQTNWKWTLEAHPQWNASSSKAAPPKLPILCHQLWTKCLYTWVCEEYFSFKSLHLEIDVLQDCFLLLIVEYWHRLY